MNTIKKMSKVPRFLGVLALSIFIDLAVINSGLHRIIDPWYHWAYWLLLAVFCVCSFDNLVYALVFWLPLFALLEDIGYVLVYWACTMKLGWPGDYTWMIKIFGVWAKPLTYNWWIFPSSYYIGALWLILVRYWHKVRGSQV